MAKAANIAPSRIVLLVTVVNKGKGTFLPISSKHLK